MLQIRDLCLADAGWVAELSGQLGYPARSAEVARRLQYLAERSDHGFYAATISNIGVGWVHVYSVRLLETNGYAEVGGIVVEGTMRRRGIGSMLIQSAEQWAKKYGHIELRLRSSIQRQDAHGFYRSLGYAQSKMSYMFSKTV